MTGVEGHIVGCLGLRGVFIPPLGGVLFVDWVSNEYGIGIAPLNGILVALVQA